MQFALIAFSVGLWAFRIGEFKSAIGFSHTEFSWLLLLPPIAGTITMNYTPRFARKIGVVRVLQLGAGMWTIGALGLSLIPPLPVIILLFLAMGICAAFFEVGLGTVAQKLDRDTGAIVSSCHGFWSIGFALGGFVASVLANGKINFLQQELIFVPIIIALVIIYSKPLPHPRTIAEENSGHGLPSLAILPLCLIPLAALFIEGAVADWNSVYLLSERHWGEIATGSVFASFMFAMALTRLIGDRLRARFSAVKLLSISTSMSIVGMLFYAFGDNVFIVFIGAFVAGMGAGNVYPLALVIANIGRDEEDSSQIISSIAMVSFTAFLFAPVFMGWIGDAFSLATAYALTIPLLILTFLWMKLARV